METYNHNHPCLSTGRLGHAKCLYVRDIGPGETISMTPHLVLNGAQLRQPSFVPFQLFAFSAFVPMRWIYGDTLYEAFITDGKEEMQTLTGDALSNGHVYHSMGVSQQSGTIPLYFRDGIYRIHKWHVRMPKDDGLLTKDDYKTKFWEHATDGEMYRTYGLPVPFPEDQKFAGWFDDFADDAGEVATTGNKIDLLDIRQKMNEYRREAEQILGEEFLQDVMSNRFGTGITREIDQQTSLINSYTKWMTNFSAEPTDSAGIGNIQGRFTATLGGGSGFTYRAREHGYVYWFLGVRPTYISPDERYLFHHKVDPTYKEFSKDPQFLGEDRPREYTKADYYNTTSTDVVAVQPAHQHARWHPAYVDPDFPDRLVYAFCPRIPTIHDQEYFIKPNDYDHIFASDVLGQYNVQGYLDVEYSSLTPRGLLSPGESLQ